MAERVEWMEITAEVLRDGGAEMGDELRFLRPNVIAYCVQLAGRRERGLCVCHG
jgi:hypothetical protein